MFTSIIDSSTGSMSVVSALICTAVSVALGLICALVYAYSSKEHTKNFIITLALLPVLVQGVIMMVSGNLGTSVAVLGTFSLVRFRSTPGTSKEIAAVFLSMAIGLATGMGQLAFAAMSAVIICALMLILNKTSFGERNEMERSLKITLPENLDYTTIFEDVFEKHLKSSELNCVKTTNMGSLYELRYTIVFNKNASEKQFIDEIRCRNGNLNIICSRPLNSREEL